MVVEVWAHTGDFHILDAAMLAAIVILPGVAIAAALIIGSRMIKSDDEMDELDEDSDGDAASPNESKDA